MTGILTLQFEASALYGGSCSVTITDTELNDGESDQYVFNNAGTYSINVKLKRNVNKESPINITFRPSNTVQLDNVSLMTCGNEVFK
jgi:hypothetical protein